MIVCVCGNVSERELSVEIRNGARTIEELQFILPIGAQCGKCREYIERMIEETIAGECDGSTKGS